MTVAVRVTARLFARLREEAGASTIEVEIPAGATVGDVLDALGAHGVSAAREQVRPALNQVFCEWSTVVAPGDEVALIPPVSGGAGAGVLVEIGPEPLDARRLEAAVAHPGAGAICTFTGTVRDVSRGRAVTSLEYEAYGEMALAGMREIAREVESRWPGARIAIAHRTGSLGIGEASVVVSVACPHRAEAIDACRLGIDRLKESVPIWKKEHAADGASWVEGEELRPA